MLIRCRAITLYWYWHIKLVWRKKCSANLSTVLCSTLYVLERNNDNLQISWILKNYDSHPQNSKQQPNTNRALQVPSKKPKCITGRLENPFNLNNFNFNLFPVFVFSRVTAKHCENFHKSLRHHEYLRDKKYHVC